MSKYTLLEIVQDVHNDLNFDLVNSISDTTESVRVALIAKSTYFEFINRRDWPHLRKLGQLLSAVNPLQPTQLLLPENTSRVQWITYNRRKATDTRDKYEEMIYQLPEDFLINANGIGSDQPNAILCTTEQGAKYYIRKDRMPNYWTSFDDQTIVMDAYDTTVESSLQGIHTQLNYYRNPQWSADDLFVPDLPEEAFPGYLAEVKSVASQKIKEVSDSKAEQQAVRQQRRLSNQSWKTHDGFQTPNYGRCPKGGSSGVARDTFRQDR